jgi:mRNA-degrading endonuclease RelE of RelBE toxin-antitoxin system
MTLIGAGGMVISRWKKLHKFHREYKRLDTDLCDRVDECLQMLVCVPIPSGLSFEKLKGYANPDIYTIHVTGNYKISFEILESTAYLRRIAPHDEIDRRP